MKSFKVRITLDGAGTTETVVQAKSSFEAKKLIKAQYGDSLKTLWWVKEIK